MDQQDEQLLVALKQGSNDAFETIYRQHFRMIRHFVINNSGSEAEASDLFQDGIIVLYEKVRTPSFELTASLKTYLYSVCRNLWLKKLTRHKSRQVRLKDFEEFEETEDQIAQKIADEQQFSLLEQCLKKLGDPCHNLLNRFYYQKQSMEVIARDLGYTNAANAKNQKYKCLQRLKKMAAQGVA